MSTAEEIAIKMELSEGLLERCLREPALLGEYLSEENKQAVGAFVFEKLTDKDGAPRLTDYKVKSLSYDSEEKRGRFRLAFQINRRFCCADVEACSNDYLDFEFYYSNNILQAKAVYFQWSLDN